MGFAALIAVRLRDCPYSPRKITSTQTAFEVASGALQMFGGNGLTLEYPVEKLLRDARASMIEDGCNEILAIKGGALLADREAFVH